MLLDGNRRLEESCCLLRPVLLASVHFLRRYWSLGYLYGVLGVECSNHSVPTIFCKGIKGLRSWFPFSFLPCAKLAQNARKTIR